ncbi:MAG: hypothetical protein BRD30_13850 [Bacteroidetes bacterium QH_2_63_10]|nr:MAG: hypothetical protein BRD35_07140 [Bacteroidetes bacterium QH_7_62_13]PSQ82573.1 MAG: hypothetical protein BRD30_13850 [Bacteroidetes bacterium QH_2_63_10]
MQLRGRQTQFYIDLIYGLGFAGGFGYLLFVGMNPMIAAFQSGLVFGYFLRVWENMSVYERILQEEVAAEAEEAVAQEVEDAVTEEVEKQVPEEMADEIEERVGEEVDDRVGDEIDERVSEQVEEQIDDRTKPPQRKRHRS